MEGKMGEENEVILHGTWASTFVKRVELALKIKGISFDYVEENLRNKSPLLLKYNPVHKKVPVLVHNGKPIPESLIILEYIDQTWPNIGPQLLPKDPFKRAKLRFWVAYIEQMIESLRKLVNLDNETRKEGLEEVHEKLKTLEDGMIEFFVDGSPEINAENLGILEIVLVTTLGTFKEQEQVLGVKILDPERNPFILSWIEALIMLPVVKETMPPRDKFIGILQSLKQNGFNFSFN